MSDRQLLAHGIGGAKDLPIPPQLAIVGAVVALAVSFTVLALAWRVPRYDDSPGRRAPSWLAAAVDSPAFLIGSRLFGLAVFGWGVMAAVFGQDVLINPFFGMFYVLLWVGVVPLSLVFGPFYRAVSPLRTIHAGFARVTGTDARLGLFDYPERLGCWPAALGLFAFVWMELVYPHATDLGPVRLWYALYVALMFVGSAVYGSRFLERADPFEVYSTLVGHLSFFGRTHPPEGDDGGDKGDEDAPHPLILRSPLSNLAQVPALPGLVAVVSVMFGSTAFDSFKDSQTWLLHVQSSSWSPFVLDNLALVGFCLAVGLLLSAATAATGVGPEQSRRELPRLFAHSMVPIIVGYVVAHYLSYLVEEGQQTLIWMSDPFSNGGDYLGISDRAVDYWLSYHPSLLASIKVLGVVVGHVVAVVAAHDRAVTLLPRRHQLTGQLPLLVVMVAFTISGIYLLFAA